MPKNKAKRNSVKKITVRLKPVKKQKVPRNKDGKINWSKYNDQLVNRGSFDIWINQSVIKSWRAQSNGKRGAQPIYSNTAILITRQIGIVFRQNLRQTEGLVRSLVKALRFDLDIPDFTTLSRRSENLTVPLPKNTEKTGIIVIADSSGLKVYGEGEWKVRQHGWSKRRSWLKFHIMITPDGEFRAIKLTGNETADSEAFNNLLEQETAEIKTIAGDGGYDKKTVYDLGIANGIKKFLIPPQKNAKIWRHGNTKGEPHPRDANLRAIRKTTRRCWKKVSGYHIRSLVETAVFRFKNTFGDRIQARKFANQETEFKIKAGILNTFQALGMPEYLPAA